MRYYEFTLNASEEAIKKNATIRLKDYDYESSITAMNKYMYQKMKNGLGFLAYREDEGSVLRAVFFYDERKSSFGDAYEYINDMLSSSFHIKRIIEEPYEITAGQFSEAVVEAKRRSYCYASKILDIANLTMYDEQNKDGTKGLRYEFAEKIISADNAKVNAIYDQNFKKELSNIAAHENALGHKGNMVHYVISGRSREAANDMAEILMSRLYAAKRISTKRMVMFSEMDPELYKSNLHNRFEEMIENNFGGVIVVDLSEKFGHASTSYGMVCKYLEKLVKRYRNDCLFVFTYNMENPGFAYNFLPKLHKYVIPVMLREGTGDRKAAVAYMKKLINASDYAQYAGQAGEFMKNFPGNEFSQTDVLQAYDRFEAWCVNKNILQAYDYEVSEDFMLDRDENAESSYDKLDKMIGLGIVKEQIKNIIAADLVEKERKNRKGNAYKMGTMHMVFSGNPGSAKTTVARLFAGIAKEKGILKSGAFVEYAGMDLSGLLCGNIKRAFEEAKGGVLFIDEAYSMVDDTTITTLIREMENCRDDVIVVLAGYSEKMQEFMGLNDGLRSRIPYWIDFPDYNEDELLDIFKMMLEERGFSATEDAMKEARYIFEKVRYTDNFGNGRYVRNLMERALQHQSVRLLETKREVSNVSKKELFMLTAEDICGLEEGLKKERVAGTAQKELEDMIGLSEVKNVIKKAVASAKLKKFCADKGIHKDKVSLHMVFTGNPGTAKTTVARLFAEIMKDEKILPSGNFVEVGRADLVGRFVGTTAPLVKKKFKEAKGGVLFIDEAYSLCDNQQNGFGDEAINTIVQEMENHRDDVIVIFAGYPEQMQEFLDRNPGMLSRITFRVNFEDYSTDELCDITKLMLSKKEMVITDEAMEKLRIGYEIASKSSDYGNGRFVRKVIEEAEMNLAQRISTRDESEITTELLTTIEERDIPEISTDKRTTKQPMGFFVA